MKRISIGALATALVIANFAAATEFEPIGIRAAARQLGIGFGQGYHGKPDLPNLRPHWHMVNRRQRWPIVTPAPYPATPFAPTTVRGSFSQMGYGTSFQPMAGEQYYVPQGDIHYHDGSMPAQTMNSLEADQMRGAHEGTVQEEAQPAKTNDTPKPDQPGEELPEQKSAATQSPFEKQVAKPQVDPMDPSANAPSDEILNQLEGFFGDKGDDAALTPPTTSSSEPSKPADTDVSRGDEFHFDVLEPGSDLRDDDFSPIKPDGEPSAASLADTAGQEPMTPRTASLPKPPVRPAQPNAEQAPSPQVKTQPANPLRRTPARRPYGDAKIWW